MELGGAGVAVKVGSPIAGATHNADSPLDDPPAFLSIVGGQKILSDAQHSADYKAG